MKKYQLVLMLLISVTSLTIMTITSQTSSLGLTVATDKASYQVQESILVYGNLTYNGAPLSFNGIATEVDNPQGDPVVLRSVQTDSYGAYNLTFKLPSDARLGTYTVYVSSTYQEEHIIDSATFKLLACMNVVINGQTYSVFAETNATFTNATATDSSLYFTCSGSSGSTAYFDITIPVGLNLTDIRVFVDGVELVSPPPTITTNGTDYFISFQLTLSTHNVVLTYAVTDLAASTVVSSKTVVGLGCCVDVNATIVNIGNYTRSANVTLFVDTRPIATFENVTVSSGNFTNLTFLWNASGLPLGNYTLGACVSPLPDETNVANNNFTGSWVIVSLVGDITGPNGVPDGLVDMQDIGYVASRFLAEPGKPLWDPNADINNDLIIDMADVGTAAAHFLETYP